MTFDSVRCVWTGDKYPVEYVTRLQSMVRRHLPGDWRFVCHTDRPQDLPADVGWVDVSDYGLPGWWAKMSLFAHQPRPDYALYLDLDTVVLGDLSPLAGIDGFGICTNFTRARSNTTWPCAYGSCVMTLPHGFGQREIWEPFCRHKVHWLEECRRGGDQLAIERLYPGAALLQNHLPEGYFLHYKDLTAANDPRAALVIFGGKSKPATCEHEWVRGEWR